MKGITRHQMEVLQLCKEATQPLDLDQLLPKLSWGPSKEAAQFTIRALMKKKMLEKLPLQLRRGRLRVSYQLTSVGKVVLDPRLDSLAAVEIEAPDLAPGVSDAP